MNASLSSPQQKSGLDDVTIEVKGGDGGSGVVSFRREKFVPRGGPDGGDGGRGGSVYVLATGSLSTLAPFRFRRHFAAEKGGHGAGNNKHGKAGMNVDIAVPLGTLVHDEEGVLADLTAEGQRVMVAKGGKGGLGNTHFTTSTVQAPRFAQKGEPGQVRRIRLELKTMADVGIIGWPNAGKSSLLARMTSAHPRIGEYPFTTLYPNLGVAEQDHRTYVVADLPGLVEGAHEGRGLGHRFLRHLERVKLLLHLVDIAPSEGAGWRERYRAIRDELELYGHGLGQKPEVVVASKQDLPESRGQYEAFAKDMARSGRSVLGVSSVNGHGIAELLEAVDARMRDLGSTEVATTAVRVYRYEDAGQQWSVERQGNTFYLEGKKVRQLLAMTDLSSQEALEYLHQRLRRLGVVKALEEKGISPGDEVRVGDMVFEWS